MSNLRMVKWFLVGIMAVIAGVFSMAVVKSQRRHLAKHGHYLSYGWHVDVDKLNLDPHSAAPRPVPGVGMVVPDEGEWATISNFTMFPSLVESCISGETPVFPVVLERLDPSTGKWTVVPPFGGRTCLNLPIRTNVIWPLESFETMPVPIARLSYWFHRRDWVRNRGLVEVQ